MNETYFYIILPFTIVFTYITARCYQNGITYFQDRLNPITTAVEVVTAEPVVSNRFVIIPIE